ncbi:glycine cleavage system T protein [Bordetella ansorpii]|uniref:Aminomethyltransferase n=1 Tax=Bordetella ansorpii TaxID=288768 RepID=A0A157SHK5_9BORD|nr:glycine cleavage system aminomethyltransferase GcvT [Bordetella ansorpii]SAI69814.1 glycine cleavage system T protein [Bordetella ansorpii]
MSAPLQRTPLFDEHLAANARMVDFGGWEMPLSYGSQIEEHHAVRRAAGMFDVSHMLNVDVAGAGAKAFLQRLIANDVARLTVPGKALYSCMLNPQGGVIDDLIVYFFSEDRWRVVVNAGTADKDVAWMRRVAASGNFDVAIAARRDLAMVAVQGPEARAKVWAARPAWQAQSEPLGVFSAALLGETLVARTGYTGEDGFEIVLPAAEVATLWRDLIAQGVQPCGLGARDTLRLEAGMNLYGQDMDELIHPDQAGLTWTVSLKDASRRFIGRDAIEQFATPAAFLGLKLQERGVMRAHMAVRTARGAGEVTSGTMSPTLGVSVGFARLPAGVQPGDAAEVEIRGKWVPAQVCKLPFVRNGKPVEHS